jgi:DNA-binding MarR family transcriptional regulator
MKMVIGVLRAGNIIDHKVSEVLRAFGITHIQFNILRILEERHPNKLSAGEIRNGLLFPTSDLTRIIDRLEKKGLVDRQLCPENRRKMDISITTSGLKVINESLPKISHALSGYYSDLISDAERVRLEDILKRIN